MFDEQDELSKYVDVVAMYKTFHDAFSVHISVFKIATSLLFTQSLSEVTESNFETHPGRAHLTRVFS